MSKFIVLEGIDGSGKSSVLNSLKIKLDDVVITKEPSDSGPGKLVKKAARESTSPYYDLFLYLADRVEHIEEIRGWMEEGKTVVCDRYWGSTAAYQAASDEISLEYTENLHKPFLMEPYITILFDVDPEEALERISNRRNKSKYERVEYLKKVRKNYLQLAEKYGWKVIDAGKSLEEVKKEVLEIVKDNL